MNSANRISFLLFCSLTSLPLLANSPMLTLFLMPYPYTQEEIEADILKSASKPGRLAKKHIYNSFPKTKLSGICAMYSGYFTTSNHNGQIIFPYRHTSGKVIIIVTPTVTPVIMAGLTVHHVAMDPTAPIEMYSYVEKKDKETGLFYWDVQKETPAWQHKPVPEPYDYAIPKNAIVLLADPKYIVIPEGVTRTYQSSSLVLPRIYVKRGLDILSPALYMLNMKHFFGEIPTDIKTDLKGDNAMYREVLATP